MLQNFFMRHLQYNEQAQRFFLTIVALGFVIDGIYAVLLNIYLLKLGYDTAFIGQVNSVGLFTFALVSLPAGIFGTWWTSRQMLRMGLACILLGTGLLPLVEFTPQAWQDVWFMLTYAMTLAGFSLYFVNGAPFLMAVVKQDKQNNAFSMQTALLALAAFFGSLFAGNLPVLFTHLYGFTLDDPQPYRYMMMLAAVVALVAFAITLRIVEVVDENEDELDIPAEENLANPKPRKQAFTRKSIRSIGMMSLVRLLQVSGLGIISVFFNVYMNTELAMPADTIGTIAAMGRLLTVPVVLLAPQLIQRSNTGAVALWASLITALCLLPIALIPNVWAASLGYIGALAVTNLRFTAFIVYIMVLVPKRQQAVMAGAGETSAGFSFALMALGGGYLATFLSFREVFLLGAGLSGLGTFVFWLHLRYRHRRGLIKVKPSV